MTLPGLSVTRLLTLLGICLGCIQPRAPDIPVALTAASLRASDTAAVLALAAPFGIPHPVRMGHPFMQLVGCPVITLVSPVTGDGDRRSWVELVVRRRGRDTGGHRCQASDASAATVKRLDRWEAS